MTFPTRRRLIIAAGTLTVITLTIIGFGLTTATRYFNGFLFAVLVGFYLYLARAGRPSMRPARLAVAFAGFLWMSWFLWLASPAPNPSPEIIQAFSRTLHGPFITALIVLAWSDHRDPC